VDVEAAPRLFELPQEEVERTPAAVQVCWGGTLLSCCVFAVPVVNPHVSSGAVRAAHVACRCVELLPVSDAVFCGIHANLYFGCT
jgi:hypothetical protein